MTSLPPPGWYPDPDTGGRGWRWWDGRQWTVSGVGQPFAQHAQEQFASATSRYGRWLRWAMLANAAASLIVVSGIAWAFNGKGFHFFTRQTDGTVHVSSRIFVVQAVSLPLNLVSLAFTGLLIAWIYQAGKFAEAKGWPAVRGRTLGAFSVLIPIVNFWWPYEAVRDSYPPGTDHSVVLRWWLSYLLVPLGAIVLVFVAALTAPAGVMWALVAVAACLMSIPVSFGWRLIADVEAMQLSS